MENKYPHNDFIIALSKLTPDQLVGTARVLGVNIMTDEKDEKGNWDTDSNDNRHVYRGDNSDVTPLQAVTVIDYNPDGSGKDTLYQFRNEETGYGFDIFVRTDDFLTRDLMFRELENALNDPDFK